MANIKKETLTLVYELSIDLDTGEIVGSKLINKETKSLRKKDNETEPKLYLEDNKYRLNTAAVELMGVDSNSKLVIQYEQGSNGDYPIIELSESGNKVTKSNTVACRGRSHEQLAKYGKEFTLVPHPNKPGVFILTSESVDSNKLNGDNNVKIEEEDEDIPFDLDIKDLISDEDANITEIDSNFFKL